MGGPDELSILLSCRRSAKPEKEGQWKAREGRYEGSGTKKRAELDKEGDHRAACSTVGVLKARAIPQKRA